MRKIGKMRKDKTNLYMAYEIRGQEMYSKSDKKEQALETKRKGTYYVTNRISPLRY